MSAAANLAAPDHCSFGYTMDYYQILQVSERADRAEIRAAYLRLVQESHPDRRIGDVKNGATQELSPEDFKRVQEAYEVLHNVARRAEYDRKRRAVVSSSVRPNAVVIPTRVRRDIPMHWLQRSPRRNPRRRKVSWFVIFGLAGLGIFAWLNASSLLEALHGNLGSPRRSSVKSLAEREASRRLFRERLLHPPEYAKIDSPKPDSPKIDSPKPDSPKPDSPKIDSPKPDSPRSGATKTGAAESEITSSATAKPAISVGSDAATNVVEPTRNRKGSPVVHAANEHIDQNKLIPSRVDLVNLPFSTDLPLRPLPADFLDPGPSRSIREIVSEADEARASVLGRAESIEAHESTLFMFSASVPPSTLPHSTFSNPVVSSVTFNAELSPWASADANGDISLQHPDSLLLHGRQWAPSPLADGPPNIIDPGRAYELPDNLPPESSLLRQPPSLRDKSHNASMRGVPARIPAESSLSWDDRDPYPYIAPIPRIELPANPPRRRPPLSVPMYNMSIGRTDEFHSWP